jgi:small subunit ribosomal protein S1
MSLGIKQLKNDPWQNIDDKYALKTKHTAKVRNFTNFGVFVEIEEGVDGLIHISDLSWTKKIKHPSEFTTIGADIDVVVLEIDKENRRLSLGHKQLEENPWDVFETIFTVNSIHEGTIVEINDKGAVIALPYGVEATTTVKHLIKQDGSKAKVDEKLEFRIVEFSKSAKKIVISHTKVYEEPKEEDEMKGKKDGDGAAKFKKQKVANIEKTTLGDISELSALKDKMENSANDIKDEASDDQPKKRKSASKKEVNASESSGSDNGSQAELSDSGKKSKKEKKSEE